MDANLSAARQHVALAQEALAAARLLKDSGLVRSSIDRAYYAAFHGANALLASVGVYPATQDGVIAMLSLHFVRQGALPGETGKALQQLYNQRLIADYKGYLGSGRHRSAGVRRKRRGGPGVLPGAAARGRALSRNTHASVRVCRWP